MKGRVIWAIGSRILCLLSGMVGAYSMMLLQEHRTSSDTLQVHKLEIIDSHKGVRAVFSVGDDGNVFLRMLSGEKTPVIELGVNESPGPYKLYTPSGSLTIRDGAGTPAIQLQVLKKDEGSLSFSTAHSEDQVSVGYMPYGDVIDGHDRGMWGIQVAEPNHKSIGLNVFAKDGVVQGVYAPLEPPERIVAPPAK